MKGKKIVKINILKRTKYNCKKKRTRYID